MYEELVKRLRSHRGWALNKTLDEAADAIESTNKAYQMISEAYEAEVTKQNWIPVTERLPDQGESVLVYRRGDNRVQPKMRIDVCPYLGDGIFCLIDVAYWMPLPEPPKEE